MTKLREMFDFEKMRRGITICLATAIVLFLFGSSVTGTVFGFMGSVMTMKFGFIMTGVLIVGVLYGILSDDGPLHKPIGLISFTLLGGANYAEGIASFFESIRGNVGFTIAAAAAAVLIIVINLIPKKDAE